MLDNNWWNNVKKIKNCMGRLSDSTANRKTDPHRQCPSLSLFLSLLHFLSLLPPWFSLSLAPCKFMYGHRQFHITYPLTAVWASSRVCLCLCCSLCYFLMSTILWTTSKKLRLLSKSCDSWAVLPVSLLRNHTVTHALESVICMLLWVVKLIPAQLARSKTSFTFWPLTYNFTALHLDCFCLMELLKFSFFSLI